MVISQGEVWWADLPAPTGSGPGFRRPVVVVRGEQKETSDLDFVVEFESKSFDASMDLKQYLAAIAYAAELAHEEILLPLRAQ